MSKFYFWFREYEKVGITIFIQVHIYYLVKVTQPKRFRFFGAQYHFQQYFSYIVAVNFNGGGNRRTRRKPLTHRKSLTNFITKCCIEYTSPWMGFELTTLAVSGTDCTDSCKSNYHMIMTMTGQRVVAHHFWVICPSSIDFNLSAVILSNNQSIYLVEETWVAEENNRPAASNWNTWSHKVWLSTSGHWWELNT